MKCSGMYKGETNIFKVYISKLRKGTEQEFKGNKRKQEKSMFQKSYNRVYYQKGP